MKKTYGLKIYLKPALWSVVIFVLSTVNFGKIDTESSWAIPHMDKIVHAGMYFIFASFLLQSFHKLNKKKALKNALQTLIICGIYGSGMELIQEYFFVGRQLELLDFIANFTGILMGIFLFKFLNKSKLYQRATS